MIVAGVLDWLNGGGAAWIGAALLISAVYLFGKFTFEKDRCPQVHPRYGRCRLSLHHRPRWKHINWMGQAWWD